MRNNSSMTVWQFPTTLWLRDGGLTVYIVFLFFRDLKYILCKVTKLYPKVLYPRV